MGDANQKISIVADLTSFLLRSAGRPMIATSILHAQSVDAWASQNGLELNLKKTKIIVIGSSSYISSIDFASLSQIPVNNVAIEYVHLFKNLGVHITCTLDWKPYVDHILKKISDGCFFFSL